MKRPSIGTRALLGAQQALEMIKELEKQTSSNPLEMDIEATIQEIDEIIEKLLVKLMEVQATILLFQDPERWNLAMRERGIMRGSQFSVYLQPIIKTASIQSLCRLWDPWRPNNKKIGFSDLLHLLTPTILEALESRSINRLADLGLSQHWFDIDRAQIQSLGRGLIEKLEQAHNFYNGNRVLGVSASYLKKTRDGWISHNDVEFDESQVDLAMKQALPFFQQTIDCFKHLNGFVRGRDFSWASVTRPIEYDVSLFLGERNTP